MSLEKDMTSECFLQNFTNIWFLTRIDHHMWPGAVARLDACPPGRRTVVPGGQLWVRYSRPATFFRRDWS